MIDKSTVIILVSMWRHYLAAALFGFYIACSIIIPAFIVSHRDVINIEPTVQILKSMIENCYGRWVVWTSVDDLRVLNVQCNEDTKESKERIRMTRRQVEVGQGGPVVSKQP